LTTDIQAVNERVQAESAFVERLLGEVRKVIVGQSHLLERLLMGLLTQGHILWRGARAGRDTVGP
jgi:MoxR-like ATPase